MTDDRERLRRIAYGPDATPRERAAAEASLRQLDEQERTAAATRESQAVNREDPDEDFDVDDKVFDEAVDGGVDDGAEGDDEVEPHPLWLRRINMGWMIPIVVGSLVIGALGAWGASAVSSSINPGDLNAADAWFTSPLNVSDQNAMPWWLAEPYGIEPRNLRPTSTPGVWVGRTKTHLCILIQELEGAGANCVERDKFAADGINYSVGKLSFHWFGGDVTVKETTPGGVVTLPVLPNPPSGPGDLDAAKALFAVPATERDAFPSPYVVESLGLQTTDVRWIGGIDGGMTAWAFEQKATGTTKGFCLAVIKDAATYTPYLQCVTSQEFETSGVSIKTLRFTAHWDGKAVKFAP